MEIFILFCYFNFISSEFRQTDKTNNRIFINPNTNFNDLNLSYLSNKDIVFIVFNTTYSNQITIDLTSTYFYSLNFSSYSFKPFNNSNNEYIYINTNSYNHFNLKFHSIFVTFSSPYIFINKLALFGAPISSNKGKINLTVDYLESDFSSLPQINVSSIFINKEFTFLEKPDSIHNPHIINSQNNSEKHATIILSSKAKQKFHTIVSDPPVTEDITHYFDFQKLNELIEKVRYEQISSEKVHLLEEEAPSETESITEENTTFEEETPTITPIATPDYFDNETNITETVDFTLNSSLSILEILNDEVIAIYENQGQETIEANSTGHLNIYTDSKSLTLKYSEEANFLTFLKLNIYLTTESIIIFDQSWRIFGDQVITSIAINHLESQLLTLMTDLDEVPYVTVIPMLNVRYVPDRQLTESYCLCTKNRLEQCIENRECFLYSVPIENYYSSSNSAISDIVANSKSATINLYLTSTSLNDFHQFLIRPFFRGRKNLNFISVVPSGQINLIIFDLSEKRDRNKVIVNCVDLTNLMVSFNYDNSIDTLVLKNSPLILIKTLSIHNLVSDAFSLNRRQSAIVYIIENLTINRAEWNTIGINFMLRNNAFFSIEQISMFPSISLSQSQVSFTGNEGEFSVGFEGNCGVKISEITNCNPTVVITSDVSFNTEIKMVIDFVLINSLVIDFTNAIPFPNGLEINFIPNEETLNSLELIMVDSSEYYSIKDHADPSNFRLYPFGNITGNIDLILSSIETVRSFMNSLNNNDFSVSNLTQISMYFDDNLMSVTFFDERIVAKGVDAVGNSLELQFDRLFITGQMTIISNTSNTIKMGLNYSDYINITGDDSRIDFGDVIPGLTSKMQDFVLKCTNDKSSSVFFDETFLPFMNNSVISKIKIDHGTKNVELKSCLSTVPNVEVIDDVAGVLYNAKLSEVHLTKSFNDTEICNKSELDDCDDNLTFFDNQSLPNYRSGPNLTVYIEKAGILVNQSQFLAENVTFLGEDFVFITKTKSRCIYNFVDIPSVSIIPTEESIDSKLDDDMYSNITDFFDSILKHTFQSDFSINQEKNGFDNENNINEGPNILSNFLDELYLYDDFDVTDIYSDAFDKVHDSLDINTSLFSHFFRATYVNLRNTPIRAQISNENNNVLFLMNHLKSDLTSLSTLNFKYVTVAADIFTLTDDDMFQATIDGKSLSGTFCESTLKNCHSPFVTSSVFIVHYASSSPLQISLISKRINSHFFFIMESKTSVYVYLDSSWYEATNAELVTFVIVNANVKERSSFENFNVTIETALYEMPNIRVVDSSFSNVSYSAKLYDPLFDANMSFYIFVSLAAAVAVISIVFLCMSIFCSEKFAIEDEKTANDINSSSSRKSKSALKITATANNSSDSSEDDQDEFNLVNVNKANEIDGNRTIDDSSQADDESTGMSLNIDDL